MRIVVAGGTGWIGRLVTEQLEADGDTAVVLARATGVDLTTGAGLGGYAGLAARSFRSGFRGGLGVRWPAAGCWPPGQRPAETSASASG